MGVATLGKGDAVGVGSGEAVAVDVGVAVGPGEAVAVTVAVGSGEAVAIDVGVAVAVAVAVAVGSGVGVGVGAGPSSLASSYSDTTPDWYASRRRFGVTCVSSRGNHSWPSLPVSPITVTWTVALISPAGIVTNSSIGR